MCCCCSAVSLFPHYDNSNQPCYPSLELDDINLTAHILLSARSNTLLYLLGCDINTNKSHLGSQFWVMPHRNTEILLDPLIVIGTPSKMLQHQGESSSPHSDTQDAPLPNDAKIEMIHSGNWLSFGHVNFTDPIYKKKRQWEFVRRNRHNSSTVDAVDILATLTRKDEPESVILVAQYRPPVQKICVEFPAGLVDPGESVYDAAKRELLEETGYYSSEVVYTSSALFYDAGLSDSNMKLVHIRVDGDSFQNVCPKSQPELDEWSMETLIFPLDNLLSSLTELHKNRGYQIDAKLFTYAYAIEMAKKMNL